MAEREVIGTYCGHPIIRTITGRGARFEYKDLDSNGESADCVCHVKRCIYEAIRNGPPLPPEKRTFKRWVTSETKHIPYGRSGPSAILKEHLISYRTRADCERFFNRSEDAFFSEFEIAATSDEEADKLAIEMAQRKWAEELLKKETTK